MALRKKLTAVLIAFFSTVGLSFVFAPPASAAPYGNVYLVVFNSRCVGGGNVVEITGAVDWVWSGGDYGDNIIYPRVELNRWNEFNGRALCNRASNKGGPYWINIPAWSFYPSRSGQTMYY